MRDSAVLFAKEGCNKVWMKRQAKPYSLDPSVEIELVVISRHPYGRRQLWSRTAGIEGFLKTEDLWIFGSLDLRVRRMTWLPKYYLAVAGWASRLVESNTLITLITLRPTEGKRLRSTDDPPLRPSHIKPSGASFAAQAATPSIGFIIVNWACPSRPALDKAK